MDRIVRLEEDADYLEDKIQKNQQAVNQRLETLEHTISTRLDRNNLLLFGIFTTLVTSLILLALNLGVN